MASLIFNNQTCNFNVAKISKSYLSLSQNFPPKAKNLIDSSGHTKIARKTIDEHLAQIPEDRFNKNEPFLVLSVRNVMANLRCIGYCAGYTEQPIAVAEEYQQSNQQLISGRPYHILAAQNDGQLIIEEFNYPAAERPYQWFLSGVPVLWDDEDKEQLWQRIVTESADHSHIWYLPRGSHPQANDITRGQWDSLHNQFIQHLSSNRDVAFKAMQELFSTGNLNREAKYLHHILGITKDGHLVNVVGRGRLEALGRQARKQGAIRALCVDNSGSVIVRFYPEGIREDFINLISALNFRAPGTAYLFINLQDKQFM